MSEQQRVAEAFVDALATRLQADRKGNTTLAMRSALAKARAAAKEALTTEEYDEAVFRAFRIAGLEP